MLNWKAEQHDAAGTDGNLRDRRPPSDHAFALEPTANQQIAQAVTCVDLHVAGLASDLVGRAE